MNISEHDKKRFEEKINKTASCWEWTACKTEHGYGRISIGGRPVKAHRVSYGIYMGKIPHGLCVLHRCDNPSCVNPFHLFIGTALDNISDMHMKGRGNIGEVNGSAILSKSEVVQIRDLYPMLNYREIAEMYGVGKITVFDIIKRKTWKHIQ